MGSHKKHRKRSETTSEEDEDDDTGKKKKQRSSKKKRAKKRKRRESSTSSSESSSSSEEERWKRKKKQKKLKKKASEEKKEETTMDIPLDLMNQSKSMAPMTKEEWEKRQSVVRRVYDETTGRHRLIKGDGEVIEEPVSRERHKAINQQATKGDGEYFQAQTANRSKK